MKRNHSLAGSRMASNIWPAEGVPIDKRTIDTMEVLLQIVQIADRQVGIDGSSVHYGSSGTLRLRCK